MRWGWKRAGNGDAGAGNGGNPGGKSGVRWREIRCPGNPVSVHHSCPGKSGGKSGVEIRCQFIILARGGNPVSVHHSCPWGSGEIRCQFIILARGGNPVSVHQGGKSGVSSSFLPGEKSGVSSSGGKSGVSSNPVSRNPVSVHQGGNPGSREIRCQFIILARKDEPTPDYAGNC